MGTAVTNPLDQLVERVIAALWHADRTQVEIARELDISRKHLSEIRNGHAEPSLELLRHMCDVLGIGALRWKVSR